MFQTSPRFKFPIIFKTKMKQNISTILNLSISEGLSDELAPDTPWNIRDGTRLQNLPEQTRQRTC